MAARSFKMAACLALSPSLLLACSYFRFLFRLQALMKRQRGFSCCCCYWNWPIKKHISNLLSTHLYVAPIDASSLRGILMSSIHMFICSGFIASLSLSRLSAFPLKIGERKTNISSRTLRLLLLLLLFCEIWKVLIKFSFTDYWLLPLVKQRCQWVKGQAGIWGFAFSGGRSSHRNWMFYVAFRIDEVWLMARFNVRLVIKGSRVDLCGSPAPAQHSCPER